MLQGVYMVPHCYHSHSLLMSEERKGGWVGETKDTFMASRSSLVIQACLNFLYTATSISHYNSLNAEADLKSNSPLAGQIEKSEK